MVDKWIGPARERMERKGTVGSLHKALHVPEGKTIPLHQLHAAARKADRTGNTALKKKVLFAENVRK